MGGALRKTMVYLGLAEEDERYEAYEVDDEVEYEADDDLGDESYDEPRRADARAESRTDSRLDSRTEPRMEPRDADRRAAVTPIARGHMARVVPVAEQPAAELHRITTIHPRSYNDAKAIGESFRNGIPVIMNLGDMADSDAKRVVDFAAGLIFGLHGSIEKVTSKVFLLSPSHVEVTPADKPHVPERAFFNQS
jgi:cell division inhibitor SepF